MNTPHAQPIPWSAQDEASRCHHWHSYFVALRKKDEPNATLHGEIARRLELTKKTGVRTEPAPNAKFRRTYIVTVTGDNSHQAMGWGCVKHEIGWLEETLGPGFLEAVEAFYQTPLERAHVSIRPVFEPVVATANQSHA